MSEPLSFLALLFSNVDLITVAERLLSPNSIDDWQVKTLLWEGATGLFFFFLIDYLYLLAGKNAIEKYLGTKSLFFRWGVYAILIIGIMTAGMEWSFGNYYFQF